MKLLLVFCTVLVTVAAKPQFLVPVAYPVATAIEPVVHVHGTPVATPVVYARAVVAVAHPPISVLQAHSIYDW